MREESPITIADIMEALRKKLRREVVRLEDLPKLLDSRGYPDERDLRSRGRAVATFMRHILQDPEIRVLLENVLKAREIGHIQNVFTYEINYRYAALLGDDFWKQYHAQRKTIDEAVVKQIEAARPKLALLSYLAGKLNELGYSEDFELPELAPPFPPLPTQ